MSTLRKYMREPEVIDESQIDTRNDPRLLGTGTNIEPHTASCSASRSTMRFSFLTQMLVLEGATPRRLTTGAERQYGKYTMSIEVPCRCKVLRVIRKYPRQNGLFSFKHNSETVIIYESLENGEIGSISIPNFHWNHKIFGFKYNINPIVKTLTTGTLLEKGLILADSKIVNQTNKDYSFGIESLVAFLTVPGIIEDGIIISESYRKKLITRGYGSKVVEWGSDSYPLNLYGRHDDEYRYFPDIGERIRDDGILFAMRDYDPVLAVCDMCTDALKVVNHTFDKITYIPLSSVSSDNMPMIEDISVWHTHNTDLHRTPVGMDRQVKYYHDAIKHFHTQLNTIYEEESLRKRGNVKTTNEFHAKLVRARINDNNIAKCKLPKSISRTFRRAKLDDWRVEIKYGWDILPNIGFKLTDLHGGKGVICAVWPDERMPVDDYGNRFDCIVGGDSTLRRTNVSRFDEHYVTATAIYLDKKLNEMVSLGQRKEALDLLFRFYSIAAPLMFEQIENILNTDALKQQHLDEVLKEGIRLWMPQNTPGIGSENNYKLMHEFPLPSTPVTYIDDAGVKRRTVKPVLAGSLYMISLEKIGDDWGATSIPKRQHHGIPGKLTDGDKNTLPWRNQAFKIFGESEVRLLMGTLDSEFVASMINFPNNPAMCMDVAKTILTSEKPTDLHMALDYKKYASLPGRAVQYFNHIMETTGVKIVRGVANDK